MLDRDKMNCMTLIAGKNASATGRVLVAHNEDDGGFVVVRHGWVPAQDWAAGSVMPAEEGCAEIPQVSHTLGYYWTEYRKDTCGLTTADGFVNERGVVIVSTAWEHPAKAWKTPTASKTAASAITCAVRLPNAPALPAKAHGF